MARRTESRETVSRHPAGRKLGTRLANPLDPIVRAALKRSCPECKANPEAWCIGVAENSRTKGRRRSRIHYARCTFAPGDVSKADGAGRRAKAGAR